MNDKYIQEKLKESLTELSLDEYADFDALRYMRVRQKIQEALLWLRSNEQSDTK